MGILFMIMQVLGASSGMGLLFALTPTEFFETPDGDHGICTTHPHPSLSTLGAFAIEFCLTTTLVFIICGVWHPKNRDNGDSAPLRIGLLLKRLIR